MLRLTHKTRGHTLKDVEGKKRAHREGERAEKQGAERRAYLEEKIAPGSIHFAPQRWRLHSQLLIEIEQSSLCMVFDRPADDRGAHQPACPAAEATGSRIPLDKREQSRLQKYVFLIEVAWCCQLKCTQLLTNAGCSTQAVVEQARSNNGPLLSHFGFQL